jgi:hypothetical protein
MTLALALFAIGNFCIPLAPGATLLGGVLLVAHQVIGDGGYVIYDVHDRTLRQTAVRGICWRALDAGIRTLGRLRGSRARSAAGLSPPRWARGPHWCSLPCFTREPRCWFSLPCRQPDAERPKAMPLPAHTTVHEVDRPDVSECFVDTVGLGTLHGATLRLTLCAYRFEEPRPPIRRASRRCRPAAWCSRPKARSTSSTC